MNTRLRIIALAMVVFASGSATAEEGGTGHYLPGAAASFADALPGRATLAVANFYTYYDASSPRLQLGGLVAAGVDATVHADTLLGLYQTPFRLLGGDYAVAIAIPFVSMEVEAEVTTDLPGPLGPTTRRVRDTDSGIADITLYPFMLGWTALGGDLKYDVRFGIYAPTGGYEQGQLANTGKNFWTFEPGIMVSWISSKIGTEASGYLGADINTENPDTDYKSGEVVHFDGTLAQHVPIFGGIAGIGATGFYYQQISGDSGDGASLGDFEGRTAGVGPVASYILKIGEHDLALELKWLPELDTEKRLDGDYVWFKTGFVF